MSHVRWRGLFPVPTTDTFPELNVRTYVKQGDKAGVWFFSLDAASQIAVMTARRAFHLPYFKAKMDIQTHDSRVTYSSKRTHHNAPSAKFSAEYAPCSDVFESQHGTLEYWLTERYALYAADKNGKLYRGEIHHGPWPLQRAEANIRINTMAEAAGMTLPDTTPLLHYAEKIDVLAWYLTTVER